MNEIEFKKLDTVKMRIVVISDASFANAPGLKSQLGYVILTADKEKCANIIHYSSCGCHRDWRSDIATEVHALVHTVDKGMLIKETLIKLMNRELEMESYIDGRTLFSVITKNSSTAERHLQIDAFLLKESYQNEEWKRIG